MALCGVVKHAGYVYVLCSLLCILTVATIAIKPVLIP